MLSHPPGRHHTEGGDDTGEGGRHGGHHMLSHPLWCPRMSSPPSASSPLARVVPPFSVVSPKRVGQHVVSPCVVPPLRVVPPRNLARYVVPPLLQMRFQAKKTSNLKSRAAETALLKMKATTLPRDMQIFDYRI